MSNEKAKSISTPNSTKNILAVDEKSHHQLNLNNENFLHNHQCEETDRPKTFAQNLMNQSESSENDQQYSEYELPSTSSASEDISEGEYSNNCRSVSHNEVSVDDFNDKDFNKRMRIVGELPLKASEASHKLHSGYGIPVFLWRNLLDYQRKGVEWLWDLHLKNKGGILSDEMGLGKTIQLIAFLAGLHFSEINCDNTMFEGFGTVLLLCPSTILKQWTREFHTWWPWFRIIIFHNSSTKDIKDRMRALQKYTRMSGTIIITTYSTVLLYRRALSSIIWDYVVLDEGHKIKNPDIELTLMVKQLKTAHRIILTGTPIQNNLKELWSLMDFVYPRLLGTLPSFVENISKPISFGGYANATKLQAMTCYKTAKILQNIIDPYILRRAKSQVQKTLKLPPKKERILFCQLTPHQVDLYKRYLASSVVQDVFNNKIGILQGVGFLRKLCNHPDLIDPQSRNDIINKNSSFYEELCSSTKYFMRSGKMIVLDSLLKRWKVLNHRVLLFSQSRKMLSMLEEFFKRCNYSYVRMDGAVSINQREKVINKFNNNNDIFIFLLTTRVGGVGLNLTAANRVIIYDPDWNPSTDIQARERAWRIGQKNDVTIYRLISHGTIEEKIYQRQVFKQFISSKVLENAAHSRNLFKFKDIHDLFTYNGDDENSDSNKLATGSEDLQLNKAPTVPSLIKVVNKHKNGEYINDHSTSKINTPLDSVQIEDCLLNFLIRKNKNLKKAIEFDQVNKKNERMDSVVFEEEAHRRANDAVVALKSSVLSSDGNDGLYAPTWTGKNGINKLSNNSPYKAFDSKTTNQLSRKRHKASESNCIVSSKDLLRSLSTGDSLKQISLQKNKNCLFEELLSFIKQCGGSVNSQKLISRFDNSVTKGIDTQVFVRVLKNICFWVPSVTGSKNGKWVLKKDFM